MNMDFFDVLLARKLENDQDPRVEGLSVTENGRYHEDGVVYDPVIVEVPQPTLSKLTVTQNGTQTAPSGTAWNEVETNVPAPSNAIYKQTLTGLPSPIATFTGADAPLDSLKASIEGVQSGSGDPSPQNVRPISGWTGCEVNRTGKNLVEDTISGMNISTTGVINSGSNYDLHIAKVAQGMTYTFTTDDSAKVYAFYSTKPTRSSQSYNDTRYVGNDTVTAPIDGYIAFRTNANYAYAQCELGDQATTYEPYNGNTYTIPFKDSSDNPITVYGGEIYVSGGKLIVTHANIASYNGETINEPWISSEDIYTQGAIPTTGAQVVYPLTTPITYELNPLALRSNGVSNISVNCGEVTECKFYSETP